MGTVSRPSVCFRVGWWIFARKNRKGKRERCDITKFDTLPHFHRPSLPLRPIPPSHHPHLRPAPATSQWCTHFTPNPLRNLRQQKHIRPTLPRGDLGSRKCVKPVQLASCVAVRLFTPFRVLGSDPLPLMPRRLSCRELLGMGSYWDCACKVSVPKGRALALNDFLPIPCVINILSAAPCTNVGAAACPPCPLTMNTDHARGLQD